MQDTDPGWIERELLLFLERSRRWFLFSGLAIVAMGVLTFFLMLLYGMGFMMAVVFSIPALLVGSIGIFLIEASRKAAEALEDREAIRPALKNLLIFFRSFGVLLGLLLVQFMLRIVGFFGDL